MSTLSRKQLSESISRIVPNVISGAHLSFMSSQSVTHCQNQVVMTIHAMGWVSMKDLSRRLHVKMPTVTGIVSRLEKTGLVRRQRLAGDRRKVFVQLTPQGVQFVSRFQKSIAERWQEVLRFLDEKDIRHYQEIIKKIEQGFARKKNS